VSKSNFVVAGIDSAIPDNSTNYLPVSGELERNSTEVQRQTPIRSAGVLSNLYTYVSANDVNNAASCVVTLMKNGSAQTMAVTYTANQTGIKEDTSNTNTVAATDEISWRVVIASVSGAHAVSLNVVGVQFDPTTSSNCHTILQSIGGQTTATNTTQYVILAGSPEPTATEANAQAKISGNYTASNLYTYVASNARTSDTTVRSRKNGGFGNQTVTYTSTQTGAKEDTSNTDSLVDGDLFNYSITTGATNNVINFQVYSSTLINTSAKFALFDGYGGGALTQAINTTRYAPAGGLMRDETTEANSQFRPRFTSYYGRLHVYVLTNTFSSATYDVTFRDNGSNSSNSVQYTAGQTGLKSDTSDLTTITSATDQIGFSMVASNSGSGTVVLNSILIYGSDTAAVSTVGSADGTGTATGVSKAKGSTVGSADGTGDATGVSKAKGSTVGSAAGTSTASASIAATVRIVGSAAGTSTVDGIARPPSVVGTAAGTSDALGVGKATALTVGSAAGTSTVSGAGAVKAYTTGSAAGTSSVTGVGAAKGTGVGSSDGTSTATANATARAVTIASAVGTSTVSGVSKATALTVASAAGTSTVTGLAKAYITGVGSAAGTSTATGIGKATATVVINTTCTSTCSGIGRALASCSGSAAGSSTVTGLSLARAVTVGSIAGVSTVTGVGKAIAYTVGNAAGTCTTSWIMHQDNTGQGQAAGTCTVTGVGKATARCTGTASGTSSVSGVGKAIATTVGSSAGTCTVSGAGKARITTVGSAAGTCTVSGVLKARISTVGSAAGTCTVTGNIQLRVSLVATAAGTSTVTGLTLALARTEGSSEGIATGDFVMTAIAITVGSAEGTSDAAGVVLDNYQFLTSSDTLSINVEDTVTRLENPLHGYRPDLQVPITRLSTIDKMIFPRGRK